jgi:hypothetical protein
MIPHRILKKIRQIEIRANRLVTESLAGASFQPPARFCRIPCAVPDGNHLDFSVHFVDHEVNRVRPTMNSRLAGFASGCRKSKWLKRRFRVVDDPKAHFLYFASVSSRSCSQGMPRPGFSSASSARRSSSAISSGVSSSNLSRSCSKTSRCSSNGSLSICSKTCAALIVFNSPAIQLFASP